jgi:hypothetical protein
MMVIVGAQTKGCAKRQNNDPNPDVFFRDVVPDDQILIPQNGEIHLLAHF